MRRVECRHGVRLAIGALVAVCALMPARAFDPSGALPTLPPATTRSFELLRPGPAAAPGPAADTTFKASRADTGTAALLASAYPPAARAGAEQLFRQMLERFPRFEQQYRVPHNDLAVAVAVFLDGAHTGFTGQVTGDDTFLALVAQMRAALAAKPAIAAAPDAEKQAAFEQLVILGLLTEGTQQALDRNPGTPDAARIRANLRQASRGYLEAFLGTDPATLRLGPQGLVMSAAEPPATLAAVNLPAGASAIEAVLLRSGTGLGYNGIVTITYRPVVLFKDGRYTTDAAGALGPTPRIDGRWQRSGSRYAFKASDGKAFEIDAKLRARPAAPGDVLEGAYRSIGGVGNAMMNVPVVAAAKSLRFARDGSVHSDQAAGSSGGGVATSSRTQAAGRYRLDGWTITITGADGRAETRLFYRYPDGDGAIGVGSSTLSLRR